MASKPLNYKAGTASVCITPDEPLWLAGYAARTEPSHGKISDLYASALALEDDTGQRFVIASMDLIAITPVIADAVAEAIRTGYGLPRRQLLLTATHTHYGPEFRVDKAVFFKIPGKFAAKIPEVADKLAAALVQVIGLALERLEPVRLYARKTAAGFAHNRRRHGIVAGTASTDDVVDNDVPILDCIDASGSRKAILFGYACHNTTIPPEDGRFCGDWAGFAKERLEQTNPGATALFIPGAGADQNPEPCGSVELSRRYGSELADSVQQALDAPGVEIVGPMIADLEDVPLPLKPVTRDVLNDMFNSNDPPQLVKARFLREALDRGETLLTSYRAPIQVVRFGNELLVIALSGEPVVDWVQKFKREFQRDAFPPSNMPGTTLGSPLTWVAGYCNDMFGYLPTRRVQAEGGYEGGRANLWSWIPAPFTEDVEDRITGAVRRLMARIWTGD